MPTIEAKIWLALKDRIGTLVTDPVIPAYGPDEIVAQPAPYILISDIRNTPMRYGISNKGPNGYSGTLVLAVHYPIAAKDITHTQLLELAGTIAAHFPSDTRMQFQDICLRATGPADVAQPYRQDTNRVVLVRVPWSSF